MHFEPKPLLVACSSCGKSAETWDFQHPDLAIICECCPVDHDHTGIGCRPVTITGHAHITLFDIEDLLEMADSSLLEEAEAIPTSSLV